MDNLKDLLLEDSKERYMDWYLEDAEPFTVAAETLGLAVARMDDYSFNGEDVARFLLIAMFSGLEDNNWHTEANIFRDWVGRMENGESIGEILDVHP